MRTKSLGDYVLDTLNKDHGLRACEIRKKVMEAGCETSARGGHLGSNFLSCIHTTLANLTKRGQVVKSGVEYTLAPEYSHTPKEYAPAVKTSAKSISYDHDDELPSMAASLIKKVGQVIRECGGVGNLRMIIDAMD